MNRERLGIVWWLKEKGGLVAGVVFDDYIVVLQRWSWGYREGWSEDWVMDEGYDDLRSEVYEGREMDQVLNSGVGVVCVYELELRTKGVGEAKLQVW